MKVLHIFHGEHFSGAEIVAFDFIGCSDIREDSALVVNDNPRLVQQLKERLNQQHVFILGFSLEIGRLQRWLTFSMLAKKFARHAAPRISQVGLNIADYDVVIYNNTTEAALFSELNIPIPEICYVHDMISALRHPVKRAFFKTARRSQHIITVSEAARAEIVAEKQSERNWRERAPVTVVYNSAPFCQPPRVKPPHLPLSKFAFFGGEHHRKGLDIAVASLERVSKAVQIEISLSVYGYVSPRAQLRLLKSSPSFKVSFEGTAEHREVLAAMRVTDVVLVPSRRDPLPTVVLEALSSGTPVIAANVDGVPEMVSDSRFLFLPGDPLSLAKCILSINGMSSVEFESAMTKCILTAEKKFSLGVKRSSIEDIISQVVSTVGDV